MGYWSWASDVLTSPSETAGGFKVVFLNNKRYSQHSVRPRRLITKYEECISRTWNTLLHSPLPISSHLPTPPTSGTQKPSNVQKANISQQMLIIAVFLTENKNLNIYRLEKYQFITTPLTLRLLMSYIYMEHLFLMFLHHTQRRSTVGRTPLDEWPARRRDLYLTTHDTHNRQISMPPVGFEPPISAGERPDITLVA